MRTVGPDEGEWTASAIGRCTHSETCRRGIRQRVTRSASIQSTGTSGCIMIYPTSSCCTPTLSSSSQQVCMCQCSAHLVMISQRESYRRAQASGSDNRPEFPEPHKSHGRATSWPINPEWGDPRTEDSCPMRHADAMDGGTAFESAARRSVAAGAA